ncbi:MAG: phage/plasmid primase, P4 family, partial [Candidatus Bathyarchaeia archaeon]
PQGERNATLTSIAGTLRRKGLTSNEIFEMLRIINANRCKPPLTDNELETISLSISRYPPQPDSDDKSVPFTEDALAIEFSIRHKDDWRYVAGWGSWLHWDGMRWKKETTLKAFDLARKICRQSAKQCDKVKKAEKILSAATVAAVERLARADRAHASTSEQWDSDLFAFNTQSGVLDTKTGAISPHSKQYHITRLANAGIGTQCPNWLKFLNDITNGNTELCEYLSRVAGYCLTGSTEEHVLFFLYGTGANGKSVFLNTLCSIWGDYATHAPLDTFLENRSDRHPTDLAKLRGARLVIATEISHGKHWDEAKIKAITGGDTISARFMRQDFFDYKPQFKLLIAGNHKPSLRNVDEAMRRRIHLIPFTLTIPPEKRDPKLMERLLEERDGILGWAVNGCLKWQEIGLKPPQCVLSATQEYFESQDAIKRWLEDECILDVNAFCSTEELFNSWKLWAENNGEFAGSKRRFSDELERRGYKRHRYGNDRTRGFIGISTKTKPFQENIL